MLLIVSVVEDDKDEATGAADRAMQRPCDTATLSKEGVGSSTTVVK